MAVTYALNYMPIQGDEATSQRMCLFTHNACIKYEPFLKLVYLPPTLHSVYHSTILYLHWDKLVRINTELFTVTDLLNCRLKMSCEGYFNSM